MISGVIFVKEIKCNIIGEDRLDERTLEKIKELISFTVVRELEQKNTKNKEFEKND